MTRVLALATEASSPPTNGVRRKLFELSRALQRSHSVEVRELVWPGLDWREVVASVYDYHPDIVHCDTFLSGRLVRRLRSHTSATMIWSLNDAYSRNLRPSTGRSIGLRTFKFPLAALAELAWSQSFDYVDVVSAAEADWLRRLGVTNVRVLPIGRPEIRARKRPQERADFALGLMSSLDGQYGEAACDFARALVGSGAFESKDLLVVGRGEHARGLSSNGVAVVPYVEKREEFLGRIRVAVLPLDRDLGLPNKALEALAYGTPVVGRGQLSALGAAWEGRAFFRESTWTDVLGVASWLVSDGAAWQRASVAASTMMDEWPTWDEVARRYLDGCQS